MYNYFSLVTFTLNKNGGAEIILEKLTKEVMIDGKATVVPCTKEESVIKLHKKMSETGGNANTQDIKCVLLNPSGNIEKIEEVIKPVVVTE